MTDVDTGAVEASAASAGAEGLAAGAERPERRHLTVMFCDLARSTSLSRELDPEDYRLVLRAYQRACAAVFSRYGGFVSKYEGDGIRVLYGFPSAHEDNAERAVRAGLEIAAAVPAIRLPRGAADLGESLSVRVSIATSMVVVGETIGSGVSKEMPVWGEAPNLAARLKARSQPNTVVVCEATKELLGNAFDLDDLGSRHVEGYSEPVPAWRVVSAREPESRFEALGRGSAGRFVGRRGELADMRRLWERAKGGDGNVVLIAGEAGIGKSRLLEEFTKRLEPRGSIVLRYQCSPFHVHSALYPLITNLARIARDEVDDSPSAMLDRLEQWLEFRPEESREELMPLFAELLSIPVPEGRYRDAPLAPEQRRRRTMAALEQQLAWLAEGLPLLLLVEDVHWADPSTLELLERCIARIAGIRALLVVTHRPEFTRAWQESEHVRRLALEPLDAAQSRELIESLSGGDTLQEGVVEELVAKADGVPLYLEELATAVIDGGPVPGEGRRRGGARRDIPASLQDSLLARLDQLGSAKETAELGAVIGRAFSVELLEAISTRTRAQLEGALARLAELGLVVHAGAGRYHFRHALIREAAYGCLLKSRRQQLHGEVARALEARFPDSVARHPEILARHCREAGQLARAVDYAYLAAKQALSRSANAEAIEHIDNALALIDRVPETDPDAMPEPARSERRLELLIALGTAYRAVKGFASSRTMHAFERALSLCKRGIGGSQELAAALRGLYTCHYVRGDHRVSRAMGAEVLEQAQRAGEPARLIAGHYMLGASMFWQGEFAAARREFEDALRLYRKVVPQDRELSEQVDLKVTLMNHLAWALWMLGHPEQAMQTISASLKAAHDLPQPFTQAMALFVHGAIHSSCHGGRADARRLASLRAISESYGLAFPAACARVLEGQASIADGETRRGIERILSGMAAFDEQEAGLGKPWGLASAAAGYLRLGEIDAGLEVVRRTLGLIEASGEYQWHAELHRIEGELLMAAPGDRLAEAEARLRRAIEIAASQETRSLELRARTSLARLLAAAGRGLEGRRQLAAVIATFEEGEGTHDLREAVGVLRELEAEGGGPAARAGPDSRSPPREMAARARAHETLPDALERWRRRGRLLRIADRRLFVLEAGDPDAEPLVVLHGFPSCSFDFHRVVDRLAERHRVIVHDHLGLGLSEKPVDYSYSLLEQTDMAVALWRALGITRARVLAHDYGASVATELLARRRHDSLPLTLAGLTLCNASLYPDLARLRLTQRLLKHPAAGPVLARLAGKRFFAARLAALWGRGEGPRAEDVDALWSALALDDGRRVLPRLAAYPDERRRFRERWLAPLESLDLPVHVIWGRRDPIAVAAIAERLDATIPRARLTWIDECGHVPMLEDPSRFAEAVLSEAAATSR